MMMKILLAVDGSIYSSIAIELLKALKLHAKTELTIMTVVPEHKFVGGFTLDGVKFGKGTIKKDIYAVQEQSSLGLIQDVVNVLNVPKLKVERLVRRGVPANEIIKVAEEREASLIIMGAKGITDSSKFLLGSVTHQVMRHAKTSVLIAKKELKNISRILLATDGSKFSDIASKFLLEIPIPHSAEIIVITALQSHLEAWIKTPTLDLNTNQDLLNELQTAEEAKAREITLKLEDTFNKNKYKVASIIAKGGASECILAACNKYKPEVVVLGSKGLTGVASYLLGSVVEKVTRYADCSVLICRPHKERNITPTHVY